MATSGRKWDQTRKNRKSAEKWNQTRQNGKGEVHLAGFTQHNAKQKKTTTTWHVHYSNSKMNNGILTATHRRKNGKFYCLRRCTW